LAVSYIVSSITILSFGLYGSNLILESIMLLVCGFMLSASYPLTYTLLSDRLQGSSYSSGSSFGALSSAQTVGASMMGFIAGLIIPNYGLSSPFLMIAILMAFASFIAFSSSRKTGSITKK
jgi:predicted MFS family arabinose efflux permease